MTLEYLQTFFDLKEKIKKTDRLITTLRESAQPGAQNLDGMPHSHEPQDKVGRIGQELADLDAKKKAWEEEAKKLEPPVLKFIAAIEDPLLHTMFNLRYMEALSWKGVADTVHTSKASAKMLCYNYLRKLNDK